MAQPGLGENRWPDGQRDRPPARCPPLGRSWPGCSGVASGSNKSCGPMPRTPDSSSRGPSDDREPRHDRVLGGGAAAVGLPGRGRLSPRTRPRFSGTCRSAAAAAGSWSSPSSCEASWTPREPRNSPRMSRPGWSGSWLSCRRAHGTGPDVPAEIKDTVQQAYAAIATGASTRHRPTAPSDSEIDKALA
jgi:hypothetical protein